MEKPGVLFLCTANSARSVMAEAFFRREAGDRFEVASAGLDPRPIHPMTVKVMREVGIDLEGRKPRAVRDYLGRASFRYVVFVCKEQEESCPFVWPFAMSELHWPFDDPAVAMPDEGEQLSRFRSVRDQIEAKVLPWARAL